MGALLTFPLDTQPANPSTRIRELVDSATMIFVDLTFERPSCYYELALAEQSGTKMCLVAETNTKILQMSDSNTVNFFDDMSGYRSLVAKMFADAIAT